jgi:hypothetical protein
MIFVFLRGQWREGKGMVSALFTRVLQGNNQVGLTPWLGEGLKVNSSLQWLNLVRLLGFVFGSVGKGSVVLTFVLQENNQIGDVGAALLGEWLEVNSSLQYLNVVSFMIVVCFLFWRG